MISIRQLLSSIALVLGVVGATAHAQAQEEGFRHWITDRKSPSKVGIQVKVERFTPEMAVLIMKAGFDFVRFGVWENAMQNARYRKQVNDAFASARNARLPVLITVRSTSPLMDTSPNETRYDTQLRDAAKKLVQVVRDLVRAHPGDVLAVELWNEPELPKYWPTGQLDKTFPVYMQAVCAGLKDVHGSTEIVGFGFATAPEAGSRSDRLLRSLGASPGHCIDAISYHAYGMSTLQMRNASQYVLSQYGLPTLITEWGVSSGSRRGIDGQAADIQSYLMTRDLLKTPLISIYEWQDTASGENVRERNFGIVDASGVQKLAFGAALTALRK